MLIGGARFLKMKYSKYSLNLENGKRVLNRVGDIAPVLIDNFAFTCSLATVGRIIEQNTGIPFYSNTDILAVLSVEFLSIFGFGISSKASRSNRFYREAYYIAVDGVNYGCLHVGGQNDTFHVEIFGSGCLAADDGWEYRLHDWILKYGVSARVTRCDVASDYFDNSVNPDICLQNWRDGMFNRFGRLPVGECVGSDWVSDTQRGKTFYIGSRQSGVFSRCYDKAKQLGDKSLIWNRFEIEFKGSQVNLGFDILLAPEIYFASVYPLAFDFLCSGWSKPLVDKPLGRKKKVKKIVFDVALANSVKWAKNQAGALINYLFEMGKSKDEIFDMLVRDAIPKVLTPSRFYAKLATNKVWLHDEPVFKPFYSDML